MIAYAKAASLLVLCCLIAGCSRSACIQGKTATHKLCCTSESKASTAQAFPIFYDDIKKVADVILSCQVQRGGICRTPAERQSLNGGQPFMTSYSFGAVGLVHAFQMTGDYRYMDSAKKFIDFWMAHQNQSADRFGIPGTFYDQLEQVNGDVEPFIYDSGPNKGGPGYDASDSDGLMVAITAYQYYCVTGDKGLLERYAGQFKLIGDSVMATMDRSDNATWCHPNFKTKYLMDICEVTAGLRALSGIFDALGKTELSQSYSKQARLTADTIYLWWSDENGWYHWFKKNGDTNNSLNWSAWYPDASEQIWPLLWDVTTCDQDQSIKMWKNFNANIPEWPSKDTNWPSISTVAIKMGSLSKAVAHTGNILSKRLNDVTWQANDCALMISNCCIDFDLNGPVCVVENSVIRQDNIFKVKLHSLANGPVSVRLRLGNRLGDIVELNAEKIQLRQAGAFDIYQYNAVQGQVNELTVVFSNPAKDSK